MKENRLVKGLVWGASVMLGFVLTDKLYDTGMKMIDKKKEAQQEDEQLELVLENEEMKSECSEV